MPTKTKSVDSYEDHMEEAYVKAAKKLYERRGAIEVDPDATVSLGEEDGAYVQAWVWVDGETARDFLPASVIEQRVRHKR